MSINKEKSFITLTPDLKRVWALVERRQAVGWELETFAKINLNILKESNNNNNVVSNPQMKQHCSFNQFIGINDIQT